MCGIAGVLDAGAADGRRVYRMTMALRHRGPDDEGYVATTSDQAVFLGGPDTVPGCLPPGSPRVPDAEFPGGADVVLGVRRLAILDPSPAGHQPMGSAAGRFIVHNGEIYNYRELRTELAAFGHRFMGGSDTEVALAAYEQWGTDCFGRFNGMWATAIWDRPRGTLVLARDRFGVKPLYLAAAPAGGLAFASEIKALLAGGVTARPHEPSLSTFLDTGRIDVSGAATCFDGIEQVEPGTFVEYPLEGTPAATRFYRLAPRVPASRDAAAELVSLLDDAVALRLRSDVPVGSCLSGGLDSSAIVSLAQSRLDPNAERMRTFTFAAAAAQIDETRFATAVADRAGAEAYFATAPDDMAEQVLATAWDQDEPIGSGSVVAQRLVMALAHANGAKVLLDGQGGDEVLAGYSYYRPARLADLVVSLRLARAVSELRSSVGNDGLTAAWLGRATLGELRRRRPGHGRLVSRQLDDIRLHLPALLHYEDRNSMAFSIEARLPFLDYRIVELGLGLPGATKIAAGWTKAILRHALESRLPADVVWRRDKVQFSVPQVDWLRGPLRELAGDLLSGPSFAARPVADAGAAHSLLARIDVLDGTEADRLWRLLALELWYRTFLDAPAVAGRTPVAQVSRTGL
ncbi:MAG TPA: asparagine synthase (glutamine-hydrolyzing) [Gaiellaceae bacterium]|nr:asparagine synthase (glutamine-hydrolyzing) [Gaiellaceae bacterium]